MNEWTRFTDVNMLSLDGGKDCDVDGGCVSSNEQAGACDKRHLGDETEFSDIDNLFDGITHELNELLTSAVDS